MRSYTYIGETEPSFLDSLGYFAPEEIDSTEELWEEDYFADADGLSAAVAPPELKFDDALGDDFELTLYSKMMQYPVS